MFLLNLSNLKGKFIFMARVRISMFGQVNGSYLMIISHSPDRMHKAGGCRLQAKDVLAYVGGGQGREDSLVGERPVQDCQLDGAGKTCTVFDIRSVLKSVTLPSLRYYSSAL